VKFFEQINAKTCSHHSIEACVQSTMSYTKFSWHNIYVSFVTNLEIFIQNLNAGYEVAYPI